MAIKKSLADVPAAAGPTGEPPDNSARYGPALAQAWFELTDHGEDKPTAFPTRLRNSMAGKCTRSIQYEVAGVSKSNPIQPSGFWVMGLGTIVHERWQEAMANVFPNSEAEVKVRYDDFDSSGHIDLVINEPTGETTQFHRTTSLELKTINGFGFKKAVGGRGPAEGPRHGHKLQCALNAVGVNADEMVIVYLAMENMSPNELKKLLGREPTDADDFKKFTAEWSYPREVFEPWAEAEMARMSRVLEYVDDKQLVPRFAAEMPPKARIMDPSKGTFQIVDDGQITGAGTYWGCSYCNYRSKCIMDGNAGPLEV